MSVTIPGSLILALLVTTGAVLWVRYAGSVKEPEQHWKTVAYEVSFFTAGLLAVGAMPFWLGWFLRGYFR